jgi:thiamine pyrophosphokinase
VKRAVLVLSGDAPPAAVLEIASGARLVAVDGGGNVLAAWGRLPDVLVGDMDSIRPDVLAAFEKGGVEIKRHPALKRDTDAALAVADALAWGAEEIVLAGATGGRLDQTLANFGLVLRAAEAGARVRLVEAEGDAWTVAPGKPLEAKGFAGRVMSVLPLSPVARGVTLTGFRWALDRATMTLGDPYGVSNVVETDDARVSVEEGVLLAVVPRRL